MYLAVSVGATRSTDLVPSEAAAAPEGVASGAAGTPADGHVVLHQSEVSTGVT